MASGLGWRDPQALPLETANAGNGVAGSIAKVSARCEFGRLLV